MISETRLKKVEEKAKVVESRNYKYIFRTHEELEQDRVNGLVDPEACHILIIDE